MCKTIAIIFAGGIGQRLNHQDGIPKQFLLLDEKPVIIHTLDLFECNHLVTDIIVVCLDSWITKLEKLLQEYSISKVVRIIPGGSNTQESIFKGLCEAEKLVHGEDAIVLIHDGVRPLICDQTITDNVESVKQLGTCITCALPTETIIINHTSGRDVPRRNNLLVARAPQSFWLSNIIEVHRQALEDGITNFVDCCEMMHHYDKPMNMVLGPTENLKITTIADFYMCEALLKLRKEHGQL